MSASMSSRRDGRTAATVPDQVIVATLEAAGELPPLPATRQQAGGRKAKTIEREGAAARAGASALGRTAERNDHAARARAIRVENERASRDRRPRPAVPAVREWVREARRAERRLGIGR